ncbi:hypothetical protein D9758_014079 [Tetrapyrgos nigripes]|uniref:GST N-terminal domain-containing protein n=1 Tax=Tetrapyrgos nigripes TaxID=182062 RepID=A0A8H5FLV6_9AGAR|nr:hypothetical protein D9758_014079 [Tetrapyrgos nigripes]
MTNMITFYDLPSKKDGVEGWNANTWKTRLSLRYKGLPFKTVWVEYPDVESTLKAAGIPPTSQWPDGRPMYTLPAIVDPSTGAALADSLIIAEYLDKTYPGDKPLLIPTGTKALQAAYIEAVHTSLSTLFQFLLGRTCETLLNPSSDEYFRRTRKEYMGIDVDALAPQGERVKEEWKNVEAGFGKIATWLKADEFAMGNTVSFADLVVTAFLEWCKNAWGEDSQQWKDVASWHDGRWGKLVRNLEAY